MGSGKKIGIGIAGILIVIGIAFGVLGSDTAPTETSELPAPVEELSGLSVEVKIGLLLPLTGDLPTHGLENLEASRYGVVNFNNLLE